MKLQQLLCAVVVLGLLAVASAAVPPRQAGRLDAKGDWICYEGWDVAGTDVPPMADMSDVFLIVNSLDECKATSCPNGVKDAQGQAVFFCVGQYVVYDKNTRQCWRKGGWGDGPHGVTERVPQKTACIQNRG